MAVKIHDIVDIPEHCVTVRNRYIYLIIETFRNKKGQPDNKKVMIGIKSEIEGKMVPNLNYYKIFNIEEPVNKSFPDTVRRSGSFAAIKQICDSCGLYPVLKSSFPGFYDKILTCAHYIVTSGNVMYYLDDWLDQTLSFSPDNLNDVAIGRVFKQIDSDRKKQFFSKWIKERDKSEFVAYDVTSISSYSRGLEDLEYGYNRDKEKLPQINFGMYFGEESKMPFFYTTYPGSITDKTHCKYMINSTNELDFKKAYFVMDKGFFSDENLRFLTSCGHRFMITVPPSLRFFRNVVDECKNEIKDNIQYKLGDELIYCKESISNVYGFRMKVHVYYNQMKAAENSESFYKRLKKMTDEISEMKELPSKNSIYYDYFDLNEKNGHIVAEKKVGEINKALSRCGFFVIAETLFDRTSNEVLETYRRRDTIEKSFDDLKNEEDLKRIRCSKDETAAGKMFVTFIALIITSQLRRHLSGYCKDNGYTLKKVLFELDKAKVAYNSANPSKNMMLCPLTKKQRKILELLGMSEDDYIKAVNAEVIE